MNATHNNSMDVRQKQRRCLVFKLACVFAHVISIVRCFVVNLVLLDKCEWNLIIHLILTA